MMCDNLNIESGQNHARRLGLICKRMTSEIKDITGSSTVLGAYFERTPMELKRNHIGAINCTQRKMNHLSRFMYKETIPEHIQTLYTLYTGELITFFFFEVG